VAVEGNEEGYRREARWGKAVTKPDTVLTAMFHEDWLKYFKPLHTPARCSPGKAREKRTAVVWRGSTGAEDGFYRTVGLNFAKGKGMDADQGWMSGRRLGLVKGSVC